MKTCRTPFSNTCRILHTHIMPNLSFALGYHHCTCIPWSRRDCWSVPIDSILLCWVDLCTATAECQEEQPPWIWDPLCFEGTLDRSTVKVNFFLIECTTSQWEWYWKRKTYRFSCFIVSQINIFKIPHRKFCKIFLIENRNRCYLDFLLSGVNGFFSFVQTSSSKLW